MNTDADLIKQMWLAGMPADDTSLVRDMRLILNARDTAFDAWTSASGFSPGEFGTAQGIADRMLRRHFAGDVVGNEELFRSRAGVDPSDLAAWHSAAKTIDWQYPKAGIFSPQGPLQDLQPEIQRVREHVARRAIGYTGYEQAGLVDPEEGPGIAMIGGLRNLELMKFIAPGEEAGLSAVENAITYGINQALDQYSGRGSREVSFDLSDDFMPTSQRTEIPSVLQEFAGQPAGAAFEKMGMLTPDQETVARNILEMSGSPAGDVLTTEDAYRLYEVYRGTFNAPSFYDLPSELQPLRRGSKPNAPGLESEMRQIERGLWGKNTYLTPEQKTRVSQERFPGENPLGENTLENFSMAEDKAHEINVSHYDPLDEIGEAGVSSSTPRQIAYARLQAVRESTGTSQAAGIHSTGVRTSKTYQTWAEANLPVGVEPGREPATQRMQDQELYKQRFSELYERRTEIADTLQDRAMDAYQAYRAGSDNPLGFEDWLASPEVSGEQAIFRRAKRSEMNLDLVDRLPEMDEHQLGHVLEGVNAPQRTSRPPSRFAPVTESGRLPSYLSRNMPQRVAVQSSSPVPDNPNTTRFLPGVGTGSQHDDPGAEFPVLGRAESALTEHGYLLNSLEGTKSEQEAIRREREDFDSRMSSSGGAPPDEPPAPPIAPEPEFPSQENPSRRDRIMQRRARAIARPQEMGYWDRIAYNERRSAERLSSRGGRATLGENPERLAYEVGQSQRREANRLRYGSEGTGGGGDPGDFDDDNEPEFTLSQSYEEPPQRGLEELTEPPEWSDEHRWGAARPELPNRASRVIDVRRARSASRASRAYSTIDPGDLRRSSAAERNVGRFQRYLEHGYSTEDFVSDSPDLSDEEAELARSGEVDVSSWATARSTRFSRVVRAASTHTMGSLSSESGPEEARGYSLALEAVSRANDVGVSGHESTETMLKNLTSRARKVVNDTLEREMQEAGGSDTLQDAEQRNRVRQLASGVVDRIAERAGEVLMGDEAPTAGQLGSELHRSLTLKSGKQGEVIQQLYQQDQAFRQQVDEVGYDRMMARGGVFDRDDGSQVEIWGSGGRGGGRGGGFGGGSGSSYGAIRAYYAQRAVGGVFNMAIGESLSSMRDAEGFESALSTMTGTGPGPVQSFMTQQANNQVWAGLAAQQQFGWMMDIPQNMLGTMGSQRMYQAGRFAAGLGASGYMTNAMLSMMPGMEPIAGLGSVGLGLGAGYLGLAGFAELTGREGVGAVVEEASGRAMQVGGIANYYISKLLGRSDEDILSSATTQSAMDALGIEDTSSKDTLIDQLKTQFEGYSDQYDVTGMARGGAQLSRIFGESAPWTSVPGSSYAIVEMAKAGQRAGVPTEEFTSSAYQYASERYPQGLARLTGMIQYAQMPLQEQFALGEWSDLTRTGRNALVQAGISPEQAWSEFETVYPTVRPEDAGAISDVSGLSAVARSYGIDLSMEESNQLVGGLGMAERGATSSIGAMIAQRLQGRPYAEMDFQSLMEPIATGGLFQSFTQSGQSLAGMTRLLGGYADASTIGRKRIEDLVSLGGQLNVGTQWLDTSGVTNLKPSQYNMLSSFLGDAYQGGGVSEFSSLFTTGLGTIGGLQGDQITYTQSLMDDFRAGGMNWTQALTQASGIAGQFGNAMDFGRYSSVYSTALGTGVGATDAARYAGLSIGSSVQEYRDLSGVLQGDPWSLSRQAQRTPGLVPQATIDVNTGLSVWQEDIWSLQDQSHALQLQNQQFNLQQSQQQYSANQAMQFGGSFYNPVTGQNQNVQYGQLDISDALYDISVRQQTDALAYQQQQLTMSSRYQREGMQSSQEQTMTRMDWRMADWEYSENVNELQFAWQMEDFDENIRFSRGRDRRRLMKQRDRAVISESMRSGHADDQKERLEQEKEWAEEAHERQSRYFEENFRLQQERLTKDREYFNERLEWQQRERELSRMSAELQSHWQQQSLQHQQQQLNQEEAIYQQQIRIDRERIRVQGEVEVWLQNIHTYVSNLAALYGSSSGTAGTAPQVSGTGGRQVTEYAGGGTPDLYERISVGERQPETVVYASGDSEVVGRSGREHVMLTEPARILPSAEASSGDLSAVLGVLQEISMTLRSISAKGGGQLVLNIKSPELKPAIDEAERIYNDTFQEI